MLPLLVAFPALVCFVSSLWTVVTLLLQLAAREALTAVRWVRDRLPKSSRVGRVGSAMYGCSKALAWAHIASAAAAGAAAETLQQQQQQQQREQQPDEQAWLSQSVLRD